jgi:hypothetical protein
LAQLAFYAAGRILGTFGGILYNLQRHAAVTRALRVSDSDRNTFGSA